MVIFGRNRLRLRQRAPFPWTRSSLPRFSGTLEGYGEFHLACAPACHWNACEPNPALGSLSQAASSANLCRSAGKAYQPVGRGPVILLCSIALPAVDTKVGSSSTQLGMPRQSTSACQSPVRQSCTSRRGQDVFLCDARCLSGLFC